jgi:hypothetical protein
MNRKSLIVLLFAGVATLLLAGCAGDGSIETEGPKSTTITTQATVAGALVNWSADLSGADIGTYTPVPCDPSTDTYCVLDFAGVASGGQYIVYTDDIPANWSIGANDGEGDQTCQQGATWEGTLTTSGPIITCGDDSVGQVKVAPSICTTIINYNTGQIEENNCPSTIELTTPVTMSTAHAMAVGTYDDSGASAASNSITASSSTTITVPLPPVIGNSVIVIVDPTTNKFVAAGFFTRNQTIYYPCGTKRSCG